MAAASLWFLPVPVTLAPAPRCRCEKSGKYTAHSDVGPGDSPSDPAPSDELPGDPVALYLVGALADDHQRRVAKVAFDVVFGGIAVAAVDTHGVEGDIHGGLRG